MRRTRRFLDVVEAEEAEKERLEMLRKAALGGGGAGEEEGIVGTVGMLFGSLKITTGTCTSLSFTVQRLNLARAHIHLCSTFFLGKECQHTRHPVTSGVFRS